MWELQLNFVVFLIVYNAMLILLFDSQLFFFLIPFVLSLFNFFWLCRSRRKKNAASGENSESGAASNYFNGMHYLNMFDPTIYYGIIVYEYTILSSLILIY